MKPASLSAFGSVEPLHDADGDRIRWSCPRLIGSVADLAWLFEQLDATPGQAQVSRICVKFVSRGSLSQRLRKAIGEAGYLLEACIPLENEERLEINFIGRNSENRQTPLALLKEQGTILESVLASPSLRPQAVRDRFDSLQDFHIQLVSASDLTTADKDRLTKIHHEVFPSFPYAFEEKLGIMQAMPESYLLACVRSTTDDEIYAFNNIEFNTWTLESGEVLRLAETDNNMRIPGSVTRGLGACLRLELVLKATETTLDACYGETRAQLGAANAIPRRIGMAYGGRLEQHILISGEGDTEHKSPTPWEDLNVWYFNRTGLSELQRFCRVG